MSQIRKFLDQNGWTLARHIEGSNPEEKEANPLQARFYLINRERRVLDEFSSIFYISQVFFNFCIFKNIANILNFDFISSTPHNHELQFNILFFNFAYLFSRLNSFFLNSNSHDWFIITEFIFSLFYISIKFSPIKFKLSQIS